MTSLTAGASLRGAGCRLVPAALLLLLSGCGGGPAPVVDDGDPGHAEGEEAHGPALEAPTETVAEHRVAVGPGAVAVVTLPPFTVHEDLVVREVTLRTESGEVELVAARLGDQAPGARCAAADPGAGRPAAGAALTAGDAPSLVLVIRPRGGAVVIDEARVAYDVDGARTDLTWRGFRIEVRPTPGARCR